MKNQTLRIGFALLFLAILLMASSFSYGSNVFASTLPPFSLTKTYTSKDGHVTFNYPEGWIVQETSANYIAIGTSKDAIQGVTNAQSPVVNAGSAVIQLEFLTPDIAKQSKLDVNATYDDMLRTLIAGSPSGNPVKFGPVSTVKVGDYDVATAPLTASGANGFIDLYVVNKLPIVAAVLANPGEEFIYRSLLEKLIPTIQTTFTNPATALPTQLATVQAAENSLPFQTVLSQDKSFGVDFPAKWVVNDFKGSGINMLAATSDKIMTDLLNSKANNFSSFDLAVSVRGYVGDIPDGLDVSGDLTKLVTTSVEKVSGIKQHDAIALHPIGVVSTAWTTAHFNGIDVTIFGFYVNKTPFIVNWFSSPNNYTSLDQLYGIIESIRVGSEVGLPASDLDAIALSQTLTIPGHRLVFKVPEHWVGDSGTGVIFIASSQATLEQLKTQKDPVIGTGEIGIVVFTGVTLNGQTSIDHLNDLITRLHSSATIGLAHNYQLGALDGARATFIGKSYDGALYYVHRSPESLSFLTLDASGELLKQRAIVDAILAAITDKSTQ